LFENRQFEPTSPLFGTPIGGDQLEFRPDRWHQKTRVPALSYGTVSVILCLAVLVQYRRVTGGRT